MTHWPALGIQSYLLTLLLASASLALGAQEQGWVSRTHRSCSKGTLSTFVPGSLSCRAALAPSVHFPKNQDAKCDFSLGEMAGLDSGSAPAGHALLLALVGRKPGSLPPLPACPGAPSRFRGWGTGQGERLFWGP